MEKKEGIRRRTFLILTGHLLIKCFPQKSISSDYPQVFKQNKIPVMRRQSITPPGSKSLSHYTKFCISCQLCVIFCPSNVIKPSLFSYKGKGLSIPLMDNKSGYCNYKCTLCGDICPTGAILPLTVEQKRKVQIGKVHFIKENCIVTLHGTECGACAEYCPTKAVIMIPEKNLKSPEIKTDICIGCGACEHICPSIPNKAIYVEGNKVHLEAILPPIGKSARGDVMKNFPF